MCVKQPCFLLALMVCVSGWPLFMLALTSIGRKIALLSASQAEITVLGFVLCIHEVMAFLVFSIYFMFMCDSKNLALKYHNFPRMCLIFSSIKMFLFLGLKANCSQPSPPLRMQSLSQQVKSGLPSHIWTAEIQREPLLPWFFQESPIML